ncbi:MAG TPA: serine/threonine-protein kinase [Streptosporangiaceae bacterium]
MSFAPGTPLAGRYLLREPIAFGGYGEVWRATDLVLDRPVAVKLLLSAHARSPETLARFRAEARHAGLLAHENIARVYDYVEADPPFLVMELIDGPSLGDALAGGSLGVARTMSIVAGAAAGLHAAHLAGLIHRDIKPGNLLLCRGDVVKITDFGISHAVDSAPITATGMLLGTPAYMAPERAFGARASAASDLYSLGVVAYECLTGERPFEGIALEVALSHHNAPIPPLPEWVPADVTALVAELTAKDPAARPVSAGEVASRAGFLAVAEQAGTAEPVPRPLGSEATLLVSPSRSDQFVSSQAAARPRRRMRKPDPRAVLAASAVAAAALGVVLASTLTSSPALHLAPSAPSSASHSPPASSSPSAPHPASAETVTVNGAALDGQPVQAVVHQLQQLHLVVRVQWQSTGQQPPGRVVQVQPSGQIAVASTVIVTGALQAVGPAAATSPSAPPSPPGKGKGKGHGHGHGGQGGNQDD